MIEYFLARIILLKIRLFAPAARVYVKLFDLAMPRFRKIANRNLAMAGFANPGRITDGVYASIARLAVTFARFPSIHSFTAGDLHVVELGENRFSDGRRGPQPFTYEVVFDRSGALLDQGWVRNGPLSLPGGPTPMQQLGPAATGPQGAGR